MEAEPQTFNLIDEAWIPVRRGSASQSMGIAQALLQAHEIRDLDFASPLERASHLRLLLAVLHRALAGPRTLEEARALLRAGRFPEGTLLRYFDAHRNRFYLFGKEPFAQVADLLTKPTPWTQLYPETPSGSWPAFGDFEDDRPAALSLAESARALITHQTFALGGLMKKLGVTSAMDAPAARFALFFPRGNNLFETLALNLVVQDPHDDAALWELPPPTTKSLAAHGVQMPQRGAARIYTWLSRAVRLLRDADGVRFIAYGPGWFPVGELADPMVAWRSTSKGWMPLRLSVDREAWQEAAALLTQQPRLRSPNTLDHALRVLGSHPPALVAVGQISDPQRPAKVLGQQRAVLLPGKDASALAYLVELAEATAQKLERRVWASLAAAHPEMQSKDLRYTLANQRPMAAYWSSLREAYSWGVGSIEEARNAVAAAILAVLKRLEPLLRTPASRARAANGLHALIREAGSAAQGKANA